MVAEAIWRTITADTPKLRHLVGTEAPPPLGALTTRREFNLFTLGH
jgi:hypothetical protein